jgi:hypothetical protein
VPSAARRQETKAKENSIMQENETKSEQQIPEPIEINGRVLEYSEKAISDHLKLFGNFMSRGHLIEQLNSRTLMERMENLCQIKGNRITIEAVVEDSLLSSLLMNAMFGSSDIDGKPMLLAGLRIDSISYGGSASFSEQEQQVLGMAAAIIKQKLFPNEKETDGQQ